MAGSTLLPLAIILTVMSPLMGHLAGRIGPRFPVSIGPLVVAAGFLLMLRFGPDASYWRDVFPGIVVTSLGMAGAVAPLTTAVLSSVEEKYTGAASGLNSAVSRTAGLMATALLVSVLGASGSALTSGFQTTMAVCAAASIGVGVAAYWLIRVE